MNEDRRDFRLPGDVRPSRYELHLELDLDTWTARGRERIDLRLGEARREITLHAVELQIEEAHVEGGPAATRIETDEIAQTVTLHLPESTAAGEHVLQVAWTGAIRGALRGLYRSTHAGARFAATQFEATDARRAFPCFDEPEFKARYALELVHETGLATIANSAIQHQETLPDGRTLTRFAETPPISSYLVAFTVGPYEGTPETRTSTGVPVRVWLPPGLGDQGGYGHTAHERAVVWLAAYTAIPYHFGKLDAIGLSDFEAGAMENPGAITYRTTLLSADPKTASTPAFKRIFSVVAHETTHMWWGDLVTMKWWNDLWLNESFASFVGEKCTDALNPEWGYVRDIVGEAIGAYNLDQLATTHPISMEVRNAAQASERFDAITYNKGHAVLRMIEGFIGEDTFRTGVHAYLDRYKEANATADDFWRALDEASGQPVSRVANCWIFEPGHPLVRIHAHQTGEGLELELAQSRYFFDPDLPPTEQRWLIPLTITYGTDQGVHRTQLLMEETEAQVTLPGAHWYYPNAGARGFFRYALDDASLARLAANVQSLAPEERVMLLDNQWALTRSGRADLAPLFALFSGLRGERDRAVLDAITDPFGWLATHAVPEAELPPFQQLVTAVFGPVLDELGWEVRPEDGLEEKQKRARAISVLGLIATDPEVRGKARERIASYLDGTGPLDPDLAAALVSAAAAGGDEELYERYVARMQAVAATDAQEEARFRIALTLFEDERLAARTAEACFGDLIRVQDRTLMLGGLLGSRHARRLTWQVLKEHWDADVATLDPSGKHRAITALAALTPRDLAADATAFLQAHRAPDSAETIDQTLERLRLNPAAAERLAGQVKTALATVAL